MSEPEVFERICPACGEIHDEELAPCMLDETIECACCDACRADCELDN